MKKMAILLWMLLSPAAFAQSQNFEGFGLSIDYSLNSITDKSTPGDSATSRSGVPSITADAYRAINDQWLIGVYGSYDLGTTDTSGADPDAHHPIEAGGKVGYAFTEKLMAYVKLGYSWSKYSSPGYYQWINGPSYGIGAEYLLTKNLFTRVEVSQQNYKTVYWSDGSSDKVNIKSYGISLGWRF
jgi:predicted porin